MELTKKAKKDIIWEALQAQIKENEDLKAQLAARNGQLNDNWDGLDNSLPEGMVTPWKRGLIGVLIGAPTTKQVEAQTKNNYTHTTAANLRIKFRGDKDEIDLTGIQLMFDTKKKQYWLSLPGRGKGNTRFNYIGAKNGLFKQLEVWAIGKVKQGDLPNVFGKAEHKPSKEESNG